MKIRSTCDMALHDKEDPLPFLHQLSSFPAKHVPTRSWSKTIFFFFPRTGVQVASSFSSLGKIRSVLSARDLD